MKDYADRKIWLIGASSGIGRALAVELAARGACLTISARTSKKLEELRQEIGSGHFAVPLDITDHEAVEAAFRNIKFAMGRVDSVLIFAGSYEPMELNRLNLNGCRDMVSTNIMGALNVIEVALPYLQRQPKSQIGICASVAGYRGLPHGQPYSATKAALINLAESLKAETRANGLDVKLINPGFVRTGLTDKNNFKMPALIKPEQAARAIADGLLKPRFEIHFPLRLTLFMKLLRLLPYSLYFRMVPR